MLGRVMGQPGGGWQTYRSSSSSTDQQKDWTKLLDFGRHICWVVIARRRRISIWDMPGAN